MHAWSISIGFSAADNHPGLRLIKQTSRVRALFPSASGVTRLASGIKRSSEWS
jgi:hypothetical protein